MRRPLPCGQAAADDAEMVECTFEPHLVCIPLAKTGRVVPHSNTSSPPSSAFLVPNEARRRLLQSELKLADSTHGFDPTRQRMHQGNGDFYLVNAVNNLGMQASARRAVVNVDTRRLQLTDKQQQVSVSAQDGNTTLQVE
eukprot:jgi/Tetstr1/429316/TSEL_019234.t1